MAKFSCKPMEWVIFGSDPLIELRARCLLSTWFQAPAISSCYKSYNIINAGQDEGQIGAYYTCGSIALQFGDALRALASFQRETYINQPTRKVITT
jgi:hypothetical protein